MADETQKFETPEHALHDFIRDAARRCFDESNRIAAQWYGPDGRLPHDKERDIAKRLGVCAEMLQELVRVIYNEWNSPGHGWRR